MSGAEALYPSICAEDRGNIRSGVRQLREDWDGTCKDLNEKRKNLESSLMDWTSFDDR